MSVPRDDEPTFVYIIACDDAVKIGVARNPAERLKGISTGTPHTPRLVATREFPTRTRAFAAETRLHRLFAARRKNGEWFRVPVTQAAKALRNTHFHFEAKDNAKVVADAWARLLHEPEFL